MSQKEKNSVDGLDLEVLLPDRDPKYSTSPGTERGGLIEQLEGGQSAPSSSVRGAAYCGDSRKLMEEYTGEVDLIVTSPPFALRRKKEYGNRAPEEYIDWFLEFASLAYDILSDEGDLVIDIGGGWVKGEPIRSTYHFELLVELTSASGALDEEYGKRFNLAQDFYWYNPAKLPTPAQWVTIERIRVKDSVNHVWWLSKDNARNRSNGKPDNSSILKPYSDSQNRLMEKGYDSRKRPSGHDISDKFDKPQKEGAIRPNFWSTSENTGNPKSLQDILADAGISSELRNAAEEVGQLEELTEIVLGLQSLTQDGKLDTERADTISQVLEIANTRSRTHYLKGCDICEIEPHPARFPQELPESFIKLLTVPGDVVMDIFSGSNITGWMAQNHDRNWVSFEREAKYVESSKFWFMSMDEIQRIESRKWNLLEQPHPHSRIEISSDD